MSVTLSLSESAIFTALRGFLISLLPPGTPVIRAFPNRVPEPKAADFVLMSQLGGDRRISTNIDTAVDCAFVGEIADDLLTITSVTIGTIVPGAPVFGASVMAGTVVTGFLSGTGGVGTYSIDPPQTAASQPMAAGTMRISESIDLSIQLDVHGPGAANNVRIISALFRDEFATSYFDGLGLPIEPLYADDPRYVPFVNEQSQYEYRWIVDAHLQIIPTAQVPQQFFDTVALHLFGSDNADIFALWSTNVPGQVVGTNVPGEAVSIGLNQIPTGIVVA